MGTDTELIFINLYVLYFDWKVIKYYWKLQTQKTEKFLLTLSDISCLMKLLVFEVTINLKK